MSEHYTLGRVLEVQYTPLDLVSGDSRSPNTARAGVQPIRLRVSQLFTPTTMSATMQVTLDSATPADGLATDSTTYVLKLYDRRACIALRKDLGLDPAHTASRGAEYQAWLADPHSTRLDFELYDPRADGQSTREHHADRAEGHIGWICEKSYERELTCYRQLSSTNTDEPPATARLFGTVTYQSEIGPIKGLLLEHIGPSVTLREYIARTASCGCHASSIWGICHSAVDALDKVLKAGILNDDNSSRNILVVLPEAWPADLRAPVPVYSDTDLRFAVVDLGHARVRHDDETDEEWDRARLNRQELDQLGWSIDRNIKEALGKPCVIHGDVCASERDPEWIDESQYSNAFIRSTLWRRILWYCPSSEYYDEEDIRYAFRGADTRLTMNHYKMRRFPSSAC